MGTEKNLVVFAEDSGKGLDGVKNEDFLQNDCEVVGVEGIHIECGKLHENLVVFVEGVNGTEGRNEIGIELERVSQVPNRVENNLG